MNKKQNIVVFGALIMSAPLWANGDGRRPVYAMAPHAILCKPTEKAWWYELMPSKKSDKGCCWSIQKWSSLYTRSAGSAFRDPDNAHKNTTHTESLSTLFFGSERFKLTEAFSGGTFTNAVTLNKFTPLANVAHLTPAYDYRESGIGFGININYTFEDSPWSVGGSITVPVCVVEIIPHSSAEFEETLQDLYKTKVITTQVAGTDGNTTVTYGKDMAIRYDLLSSLAWDENTPLLRTVGNNTKIGVLNIDGTTANQGRMYAIKKYNGEAPASPYRKQASAVLGAVNGNGQGGIDGGAYFIKTGTNFAALTNNSATQATLWVVPRATDANAQEVDQIARAIMTQIEQAVIDADLSNRTATNFLASRGIHLHNYERKSGLGDLEAGIYGCYYNEEEDWFLKIMGGTKAPTGTKKSDRDALHVTQIQTGNNRHWELCLKLAGGWQPCDWMSFDLCASAHHVFAREELLAASFAGATVKNVGPAVEGKVSWDYFMAGAKFNFFHPHNPELGCTMGYSLYAKNKDHVHYTNVDATDLFDNKLQILDAEVAEKNTNAMTHTITADLFHRWNYLSINAGGAYDVAGRNAMKITEAHIGFTVYF